MSVYESSITNPKKQLEFYKQLSEQLQQENQKLKEKYANAVADYEEQKFNVEELKKQLEENKDKINWYENFEINKTIDELRIKHNNQQKEFISYLEKKEKEFDILGDPKNAGACKGILRKYKEIIGVSNENNKQ